LSSFNEPKHKKKKKRNSKQMAAIVKSGGVELLATGKILVDARYCKKVGNNVTVYPVGFTSTRLGPSKDGKSNTVVFTSTITEGVSGPQFFVTAADDESTKYSGENPTAVWLAALSSRVVGEKPPPVNGPSKFGLSVDAISAELKKLDGYDALVTMVTKTAEPAITVPATKPGKTQKVLTAPAVPVAAPLDSSENTAPATAAAAAPPAKPKRVSKKLLAGGEEAPSVPLAAAVPPDAPSAKKRPRASGTAPDAVTPKCELCGLSSPFCSQSGKIHAFAITPCPLCKKITLFCCETGQAHLPIHQPSAAAAAAATSVAAPTSNVPAAVKPPRKKAEKKVAAGDAPAVADVVGADGTVDAAADGTAPKAAKKPRKEKSVAPIVVPSAAGVIDVDGVAVPVPPAAAPSSKGKRQRTLDEVSKKPAAAPEDVVVVVKEVKPPPPPKPFVYPPLRAVASKIDHNALAKTLQSHPDEATQKRMVADGVTTAAAIKRYTQFLGMYVSEKTVQDAAKAHKTTTTLPVAKDETTITDAQAATATGDEEAGAAADHAVEPKKSKSRRGPSAKSAEGTAVAESA
jgi:hypothetical protein